MPPGTAGPPRRVAPQPWRRWTRDVWRVLTAAPDLAISLGAMTLCCTAAVVAVGLAIVATTPPTGTPQPWATRATAVITWTAVLFGWPLLEPLLDSTAHRLAAFVSGHLADTPRTVGPSPWARHQVLLRAWKVALERHPLLWLAQLTGAALVGAVIGGTGTGALLLLPPRSWLTPLLGGWMIWHAVGWAQRRYIPVAPLRTRLAHTLVRTGCPASLSRALVEVAILQNPHAFRWLPTLERGWGSLQMCWIAALSLLEVCAGPLVTLYAYVIMRDVFFYDDALAPVEEAIHAPAPVDQPLVPVPA